jgi:hypothetical protein
MICETTGAELSLGRGSTSDDRGLATPLSQQAAGKMPNPALANFEIDEMVLSAKPKR